MVSKKEFSNKIKKAKDWDGKSRPSNDTYRDSWNRIFGEDRENFNKFQQEQRDLDESYQQSKRNKKEHSDKEK